MSLILKELEKEKNKGNTILGFGTRLYIWDEEQKQAFVTRHIYDHEYDMISHLLSGAFRDEWRNRK